MHLRKHAIFSGALTMVSSSALNKLQYNNEKKR